jgi:hypothetical protein
MSTIYWVGDTAGSIFSNQSAGSLTNFQFSVPSNSPFTYTLSGNLPTLHIGDTVTLTSNDLSDPSPPISGTYAGDVLVGSTYYPVINETSGNTYFVGGYEYDPANFPSAPAGSMPGYDSSGIVNCFLSGTLIETNKGPIPIEKLSEGDLVLTLSGEYIPIKWIGKQKLYGYFVPKKNSPVCIHAGALGEGLPQRDLYVSPAHAIKVGDFLVAARLLVNAVTVTQEQWTGHIEYYHVDLGEHHCVLAEGTWSESFAECGNRNNFTNAAEFYAKYPEHQVVTWTDSCLPLVSDYLDSRHSQLFKTLLAHIPAARIACDPDLHLLADGKRIDPYEFLPHSFMFQIPAETKVLRLISHTTSPCELGLPSDDRQLGFCIHNITAVSEDSSVKIEIEPHHPNLNQGFHSVEEKIRRWTKGDAVLPISLLGDGTQNMNLTIKGRALIRYHLSHKITYEGHAQTSIPHTIASNPLE